MSSITICTESPRSNDASRLLDAAFVELARRYVEYSQTDAARFPLEQAEGAQAAFLVARDSDGTAVGCVVLRPFEPGDTRVAEIKRMFVAEEVRGQGIASALLRHLEDDAQMFGYAWLRLETGILQPEAIALYEKHGFVRIPCWGDYVHDPHSVCYEKSL